MLPASLALLPASSSRGSLRRRTSLRRPEDLCVVLSVSVISASSSSSASSALSLHCSPCSLSAVVLTLLPHRRPPHLCVQPHMLQLVWAINSELKKVFVQRLLSDKASG